MIRANLIFAALSIMLVSTASSQILTAKITSASTATLTLTNRQASPTKQVNTTELTSNISGSSGPTTRIFNIYTTHVPGFNEIKGVQKANLTDDQYSLQTILVNQGDKVDVNLYNMEAPSGDRHSFTIGAPYNVNIDTAPTHNGSATFVADHPGIFKFYCEYHIPSMEGQLVVLANKL